MKKLFFGFVFLMGIQSAFAQLEKGQQMIGGGFGFSTAGSATKNGGTTTKGPLSNSFALNPTYGLFLKDNMVLGGSLTLSMNRSKDRVNDSWNGTNSMGISPFVRYYKNLTNDFYVFGQGTVGFSTGRPRAKANDQINLGVRQNTVNFDAKVGLSYFPSSKIGVEMGYSLFHAVFTSSNNNSNSFAAFGASSLAPSHIGFYYFLGQKAAKSTDK